ncbi:MAG: acyltransferase [Flavobacterium sp.]|nr:acyltransferase [Flavobacterium sp.]
MQVISSHTRIQKLDFLRGIAIILVLFRHQLLTPMLQTMGWIGVDLFFVLSGFLVSGLLFQEYQKFGSVSPGLFLIRRGFKIYPLYYLTLVAYLLPKLYFHKFDFQKTLYDCLFVQNYFLGWGYAYPASWSLAVEEHFYIFLALSFGALVKFAPKKIHQLLYKRGFMICLVSLLSLILLIRYASNLYFPNQNVFHVTATHLRIDALLFGVCIAYGYYFKRSTWRDFVLKHQNKGLILALLLLSFTPFISYVTSFFVRTIGFTMVYLSFGILLLCVLFDEHMDNKLNKLFSPLLVRIMARIGFNSYAIYLLHSLVIYVVSYLPISSSYLQFVLVFILSVGSGIFLTATVESYFLGIRDVYFPKRTH